MIAVTTTANANRIDLIQLSGTNKLHTLTPKPIDCFVSLGELLDLNR
jgi:hypothetical protein